MQNLEDLCTAALTIHYERGYRSNAVINPPVGGMPDMGLLQQYCPAHWKENAFAFIPRHLSSNQYHDPYKAIKKFVTALPETEWRKALRCILEFALSNNSIEEAYEFYEVLLMQQRLLQLLEGCFLIEVRVGAGCFS